MHDQKTTLNQQSLIDFRFREKERERKKKHAFNPQMMGGLQSTESEKTNYLNEDVTFAKDFTG